MVKTIKKHSKRRSKRKSRRKSKQTIKRKSRQRSRRKSKQTIKRKSRRRSKQLRKRILNKRKNKLGGAAEVLLPDPTWFTQSDWISSNNVDKIINKYTLSQTPTLSEDDATELEEIKKKIAAANRSTAKGRHAKMATLLQKLKEKKKTLGISMKMDEDALDLWKKKQVIDYLVDKYSMIEDEIKDGSFCALHEDFIQDKEMWCEESHNPAHPKTVPKTVPKQPLKTRGWNYEEDIVTSRGKLI